MEASHLAERHIYGSSRVGMITEKVEFEYVYGNQPTEELVPTLAIEETVNFELEYTIGSRQYELSNHLGNVLAVISDWKLPVISGASVVSYSTAVVSSQDYSPFGVTLSGRSWSSGYRYGMNGMEKDDEIIGSGNMYTTEFRENDTRLGRWWSVDPLASDYPWQSPYVSMDNNPINIIDPTGEGGTDPVTVQKGNTLSGIAKDNNTSVDAIMKANPNIRDANKIYPGQKINLPGVEGPTGENNSMVNTTTVKSSSSANAPSAPPANSSSGAEYNGYDVAREATGVSLVALGQPYNYFKPVGALGSSPGSSPASYYLGKWFPQESKTLAKVSGATYKGLSKVTNKVVAKTVTKATVGMGTKIVGRFAGRLVPGVGWALLAYDIYDNRELIKEYAPYLGKGMEERQKLMKEYPYDIPVCFAKGTLVYAKNGLVEIQSIHVGDSVYSYNLDANKVEISMVSNTFERNTGEFYEVKTNKQNIQVTAEHPFYVEGKGWVNVRDLKIGFSVKTINGSNPETILSITKIGQDTVVYNIEVDGNHNYFVTSTNLLVHNKSIKLMNQDLKKRNKNQSKK
jgi:RHS repeat-associated protein